MKVIVAGPRDFYNAAVVADAIRESGFRIDEIVSGNATGVDSAGERYAAQHRIKVRTFPADWEKHGRAAGPIRNRQMAEYADALIAISNGKSRGTSNMIDEAIKQGLKIHIHMI